VLASSGSAFTSAKAGEWPTSKVWALAFAAHG
jgi:hypothetical protein